MDVRQLIELIRDAFAGVTLGDGVGLRQGRGLDMYADAEELAELRAGDEQRDWSAISWEDLNEYRSSLAFLDAEGMRFHLPALLIADLQETFVGDLLVQLTYGDKHQFHLLDGAQRQAVRQYLLFTLDTLVEPERGFFQSLIEESLRLQWSGE